MNKSLVFLILLAILITDPALAQRKRHLDDIVPGMNFNDVLQVWGSPDDKEEYEVRREEQWSYGDYKIKFREGIVFSAKKSTPRYAALYKKLEKKPVKKVQPERIKKDVAVEDILSEITQEPESKKK